MNCLAIDDEPLALEIIEDYIKKISFLTLIKKCKNAFEAVECLQKSDVDLIFLDIQMPDLNGIQLLKSLQKRPLVIFTTAFEQYAIESYELDVIDYLLKPIPFDRFFKAANKAYEYFHLINQNQTVKPTEKAETKPAYIFVKADYQNIRINFSDILYIEGLKDYIKIYVSNREKPILTLMSIKSMEETLPSDQFLRLHRSYLVAIYKITSAKKNIVIVDKKTIPVGSLYRKNLLSVFNQIEK